MRPTRFQIGTILVSGLLFGLVLNDTAEGQRPSRDRGSDGGFSRGGAPGGFPGGPPGGAPPGGSSRMGGGSFDPNVIFAMLAQGNEFVAIDTVIQRFSSRDPNAAEGINAFVQRNGITNGVLNREQFASLIQERMAQRAAGGGPGGDRRRSQPITDDQIKEWFDRLDTNKDGVLQPDEMPIDLKTNLKDWDKDGDGNISLEEFTAFAQRQNSRNGGPGGYGEEEPIEENKRQLVYRANNLPKELPPWFAQLDQDKDCQVSLFEWKKAGRGVDEFLKYDMNGDGLLTIDEVLRYEARNKPAGSAADALLFADAGNGQRGAFGPGGFGPGGAGPGGPGQRGAGPSGWSPRGGGSSGPGGSSGRGFGDRSGSSRGDRGGRGDSGSRDRGMTRQPQGE